MSLLIFALAILVSIASAVRVALWGRHAQARRRLAQGTSQIEDRALVTLRGRVKPPATPLTAPLSGRACVAYEAASHRLAPRGSMRMAPPPDPPIMESAMIAFDLVVDGRVVHVDGERAELSLPPAGVIPRRLEREEAFMERHGFERGESRFRTSYETVVEPGSTVTVQGMAVVEIDPTAPGENAYRDASARRIRIVAHVAHPITIGVVR